MICTKCGQKLPEGSRFCEYCGAQVGEELPKKEAVEQQENLGVVTSGDGIQREEFQRINREQKNLQNP